MEESKLVQYFGGKTLLIIGATGFLAKVFVEKILRIQPNVKKLFLLIRNSPHKSIQQRLQEEVVHTELFRVLREKCGKDFSSMLSLKIIPISGDISYENLGIVNSELRENMWQEIDIIVNTAATTTFYERYDVAFGINTLGAMHVRDFAIKCLKLEMLLHVSTAFVHGMKAGLIAEKPLYMGETLPGAKITFLDINNEKTIIEERLEALQIQKATPEEIVGAMKNLGIERAKLHGWPNTYVFTKAMGEMMLHNFNKEKANAIILRPTIITSTFKDPILGWIEGLRTLDVFFVAYGKGKMKSFVGDPKSILDMIPGDMVVNSMIAAIASQSNDISKRELIVYHVGSSRQNPITLGEIVDLVHRYLIKNPLLNTSGNPIKVGKPLTLNTMTNFHTYNSITYKPFLKIFELINMLSLNYFESACANSRYKINKILGLAKIYKPYVFSEAIFDDTNTANLWERVRGSNTDTIMLNFDPKCITWNDYFMDTHFRGLVKHVLG